MRLSGSSRDWLVIRSARELRPRDLEAGNFVFVGSPSSNPWVFYFQDKLNFQEGEGVVGESLKFFQNPHPKAGEQDTYQGLAFTGSSGEDYATISLLPLANGSGSVLILQGLQQEGTEAAGLFLADARNRQKLQQALGFSGTPASPLLRNPHPDPGSRRRSQRYFDRRHARLPPVIPALGVQNMRLYRIFCICGFHAPLNLASCAPRRRAPWLF